MTTRRKYSFRLDDDTVEALTAKADSLGVTLSRYVRDRLMRDARSPETLPLLPDSDAPVGLGSAEPGVARDVGAAGLASRWSR